MAGDLASEESTLENHSPPRATLSNTKMSIDFPREEERVLARWKEINAFLRQVELVSGG